MFNKISIAFKKMLGNGRAWLCIDKFTSKFIDVLLFPVAEVAEKILNLKFAHFPTITLNKNDIVNNEELFGLEPVGRLEERAANVETQWRLFAGGQNYKQIEQVLQKRGLPIRVVENVKNRIDLTRATYIANGELRLKDEKTDPVEFKDGKNVFFLCPKKFLSKDEYKVLVQVLLGSKPAEKVAYYYPPYLRKKEIHHVLTKRQMQSLTKNRYCNVKSKK